MINIKDKNDIERFLNDYKYLHDGYIEKFNYISGFRNGDKEKIEVIINSNYSNKRVNLIFEDLIYFKLGYDEVGIIYNITFKLENNEFIFVTKDNDLEKDELDYLYIKCRNISYEEVAIA